MFPQIPLRHKLYVALGINVLLLAGLGYVAAISTCNINRELQSAFNRDLRGLVFLLEADRDLHQSFIAERTMIFTRTGTSTFNSQMKEYLDNKKQADTRIAEFAKLTSDPEQLALVDGYMAERDKWDDFAHRVLTDKEAGASEGYLTALALGEENKRFAGMRGHIDTLTDALLRQAENAENAAGTLYRNMLAVIIALTIGSAVIGAVTPLLLTRNPEGSPRP